MKSIIKKCGAIILTFAMLTTGMSGFSDAKVAKAADNAENIGQTVTANNGVKFIQYKDIKNYRVKKITITEDYSDKPDVVTECYAQSPKLPGYVFAGWFKDSTGASYLPTEENGQRPSGEKVSAWAKFVPQKTFTIKAQIRNSAGGTTIDTSNPAALNSVSKVDVRFITGIDSLKYRRVIFSATHLGQEVNRGMNKVMTSLNTPGETGATGESSTTASVAFGTTAKYFATLRYTGIKSLTPGQLQRFLQDWKIIPKLITQDGTLVEGITRDEFKIQDAVSRKFQVAESIGSITPNTTQAIVNATMANNSIHELFLKGADGTRYSKSWEISGAFTNLTGNAVKGFKIQADDAAEIANKTTKYYTMNQGGVAMDAANTSSLGQNIISLEGIECKNIWVTTRYQGGIKATGSKESTYVRFKAVLIEDILSLWIDDELVWQLPLTEALFGGFEPGSSYRIALCCQGNSTKVSWTDLKVKYGDDVKPYKFFLSDRQNYNAMDEGVTLDNTSGKVTVNLDERYSKRIWLESADGVDESTYWEITGTMKVLVPLVKGFTIRDESGHMGNYSLFGQQGVAVNEYYSTKSEWGVVKEKPFVNASQNYINADVNYDQPSKFKLVIQNDKLTLHLNGETVWDLPLTNEKFGWRQIDADGHETGSGAFTAGSSYRVALRCLDEGGRMEWSDLEVYAKKCSGERFKVAASDAAMSADSTAGKVTVNVTDGWAEKHLWFGTDNVTNSSASWEITGTFKQLSEGTVMKGFTIQSADETKTGYYTVYGGGVALNAKWGWPVGGSWNLHTIDGTHILADPDAFGTGAGGDRFKLVVQNDIFSFWMNETLIWELPLTDAKYGGFAQGTSYRFAIRHVDPGQGEWSDLQVKCGHDKFVVNQIDRPSVVADPANGKITVDMRSDGEVVNRLWFATDNASFSSTKWEITGSYKQTLDLLTGFTIQSADGTKNGYYTIWENGVLLEEFLNYPRILSVDETNIFTNARYNAMDKNFNDNVRFRVVLKDDVLSLWVDDGLAWRLPLTDARFGGFAKGTSYRIAIRQLWAGLAEWSDLTVKYGEQVR